MKLALLAETCTKMRRALLLSPILLTLAGCFASQSPLITQDDAEFPFADKSQYRQFESCSEPRVGECDSAGYQLTDTGTIFLKGTQYIVASDRETPGTHPTEHELAITRIDDTLYIAQIAIKEIGPSPEYLYFPVLIDGQLVYYYQAMCDDKVDAHHVSSGLLKGITKRLFVVTCEVDTLAGLGTIFRSRANTQIKADTKFELTVR